MAAGKNNNDLNCMMSGCTKKAIHDDDKVIIPIGENNGDGSKLAKSILEHHYPDDMVEASQHPFSSQYTYDNVNKAQPSTFEEEIGRTDSKTGRMADGQTREAKTAEAHHLITSEVMRADDKWRRICLSFGYDINHTNNGVFVPKSLQIACQLGIPAHNAGHSNTITNVSADNANKIKVFKWKTKKVINPTTGKEKTVLDLDANGKKIPIEVDIKGVWDDRTTVTKHWKNYVGACKGLIEGIKQNALRGDFCKKEEYKKVSEQLDEVSADIWDYLKKFTWTLTADGKNYSPNPKTLTDEQLDRLQKKIDKETTKVGKNNKMYLAGGLGCLDCMYMAKDKGKVDAQSDVKKHYCNRHHGFAEDLKSKGLIERKPSKKVERFEEKQ